MWVTATPPTRFLREVFSKNITRNVVMTLLGHRTTPNLSLPQRTLSATSLCINYLYYRSHVNIGVCEHSHARQMFGLRENCIFKAAKNGKCWIMGEHLTDIPLNLCRSYLESFSRLQFLHTLTLFLLSPFQHFICLLETAHSWANAGVFPRQVTYFISMPMP